MRSGNVQPALSQPQLQNLGNNHHHYHDLDDHHYHDFYDHHYHDFDDNHYHDYYDVCDGHHHDQVLLIVFALIVMIS